MNKLPEEILKETQEFYPLMKEDFKILYNSILESKPEFIIELGAGNSTIVMALALKLAGSGKEYIAVDIDAHRVEMFTKKLEAYGLSDYVTCYVKDSIQFLKSYEKKVDFIFIDSSHILEQTRIELCLCVKKLKKNGKIFFHDTKLGGVQVPLLEFLKENPNFELHEYDTPAGLGLLKRRNE